MLKNTTRRLLQLQRRHRNTTALKWPMEATEKIGRNLQTIEAHWKTKLDAEAAAAWSKDRPKGKKYILSMFPYPSGKLHLGHMRVYTISDVTARYYALNGYKVIHPIGWDSFGLPAENAARERGVDAGDWTRSNIAVMKEQLKRTGVQFDWSREISTCEPDYYKWTQWIFLKLYEHGLVKRTLAEVNWDPVDGTVLAAEQIDNEGRSWRSGAVAEKKKLRQWMIETPKYAKRLSDGLKCMEQWHEVADIQANWIGQCDVFRYQFPLQNREGVAMEEVLDLRVVDPIQVGRSWFVVLRQGHPLSEESRKGDSEPYLLPIRVLNGVTAKWMPAVVVPEAYEGPQMFLSARLGDSIADRALVDKFGLSETQKVMPMTFNDVQEIASFGGYGGYQTSRTLQDWVVSRQRAWGTPIPMILSEDGRDYCPVEEIQLPVVQGQGKKRVDCERLPQGYGYYDTDTLDTFVDSAWYYLRFLDPKNEKELISKQLSGQQMPVDVYVGGVEHAAVHMFFARFISHFLTDIGVTEHAEPFRHLIPQGMVRGKTFVESTTGKYYRTEDVVFEGTSLMSKEGAKLEVLFEKMSKSKHNGVDPLEVLDREGIDFTRLQILEAGAPKMPVNWGETDSKGTRKWLDRVAWVVNRFVEQKQAGISKNPEPKQEKELREAYNFFVRNVGMCLEVLNLHNTALMRIMGFTNVLRKMKPEDLATSPEAERCLIALLSMISIYVPHISNEMWTAVSGVLDRYKDTALADVPWPQTDADSEIDFMLQIGNVSCGRLALPRAEVETLDLEGLLKKLEQTHGTFLDKIRARGGSLENIKVSRRDGFHVTLTADLLGCEPSYLGNVLDEIHAANLAAAKAAKAGKRRAKA